MAAEARLAAERDGPSAPAVPQDLLARAGDPALAQILAGQKGLFAARLSAKQGEIAILKRRIARGNDEIGGLEAQRLSRTRYSGESVRSVAAALSRVGPVGAGLA